MTTAIIGTGGLGSAIAPQLASGGETLRLSSADNKSARTLAAEIGPAAVAAVDDHDVLQGADAVVLALRFAVLKGVIDEVASSMKNNYPGLDWAKIVPYNLERMASHGERRAAEMEEVADTLRELGVEPLMTTATVKRQREMGQIGTQQPVRAVLKEDRVAMLRAISAW